MKGTPAMKRAFATLLATLLAAGTAFAADTDGEVRRIDKAQSKVTLKHGEIKNLDMPPMTMVFNVADASMLDKLQAGDKIRFKATNEGGKFTVTEIQPVK
jgi:Cu(I)/Ag(I) efflux system protein CusF